MKICTAPYCNTKHDTKYQMCPTCREDVRQRAARKRSTIKYQIEVIAEEHRSEAGCKKILKILKGK